MRIAFDLRVLENRWTGVERYARNLLTALAPLAARRGSRVVAIGRAPVTPPPGEVLLPASVQDQIDLVYTGGPASRLLWRQTQLRSAITRERCGVVLSATTAFPLRCPVPAACVVYDLTWWRQPGLYTLRDRLGQRFFGRRAARMAASGRAAIATISQQTSTEWRAFASACGLPADPVCIGTGLDPAVIAASRPVTEPRGGNLILAVGTLCARKNQAALVAAMADPRLASARLVLIGGDGAGAAAVHAAIAGSPARERIRATGFLPASEAEALWREAAVLVAASVDEGFGIPVAEAMALGVPAVVSDIAVFREVAAGHARTFALSGGQEAIASALSAALNSPPAAPALEAARQHALGFTWEAVAERLWPLLERLDSGVPGQQAGSTGA